VLHRGELDAPAPKAALRVIRIRIAFAATARHWSERAARAQSTML
jgi:hypothetical protein